MICSSTTACTYLLHAWSWQVPGVSAPPWESFPLMPRLGFPPLFITTIIPFDSLYVCEDPTESPLDIYLRTYRVLPGALASHSYSAGSLSYVGQRCLGRCFSTSGHIWASAASQCFCCLGNLMKDVFCLVPERCSSHPCLLAPFGSNPHSSLSTPLGNFCDV